MRGRWLTGRGARTRLEQLGDGRAARGQAAADFRLLGLVSQIYGGRDDDIGDGIAALAAKHAPARLVAGLLQPVVAEPVALRSV